MRKMFKRYLSLFLTVCMLVSAMLPVSLAEENETPAASVEPTVEPTAAPTEEPTATPEPTPVGIVALAGAPKTLEQMYGLYEDELDLPQTLTATYGDGTQAELPVTWVCISDGKGGTAYDGECENFEDALFTFEARLEAGTP